MKAEGKEEEGRECIKKTKTKTRVRLGCASRGWFSVFTGGSRTGGQVSAGGVTPGQSLRLLYFLESFLDLESQLNHLTENEGEAMVEMFTENNTNVLRFT